MAGRREQQADVMRLVLYGRRSCLGGSCLLKVAVALAVVVAWHLLLGALQNGALETHRDGTAASRDGQPPQFGEIEYRKYLKEGTSQKCELPRLFPRNGTAGNVQCRRMDPLPNSCRIASELFNSKPPDTCQDNGPVEICQIKAEKTLLKVHCDAEVCKDGLSLGLIDADQGTLQWTQYEDTPGLQHRVQEVVDANTGLGRQHDFCFVRCLPPKRGADNGGEAEGEEEEKEEEEAEEADMAGERYYFDYLVRDDLVLDESLPKQLLILPLQLPQLKAKNSSGKISFNVYLLDSVSHSHFFRSLPRSVDRLRKIRESAAGSGSGDGGNEGARVFSFNLMQSLKGRTYENLQALFAGELYNPANPFGTQSMPPKAVRMGQLLAGLKAAGYRTAWTEDLCWTWEWGIAKNLVVHSPGDPLPDRWRTLAATLEQSGVDGLNFSLASCEILRANGIRDTFHGPATVCYNGRHHHHYTLEYLKAVQSQLTRAGQPFFHFTMANVAHEDTGRRLQTLDESLADYLGFLATQDDMVTVVLADHGNSYGALMRETIEARVEMFHPLLLILVSENVAERLGAKKLRALSLNQDRLVSILDLYHMLQSLSPAGGVPVSPELKNYDLSPDGLLAELSSNRTCDSVPRIDPNVCICSDYEKSVANDSRRAEVARAVLRKMNEVILEEAGSGHRGCKMLEMRWFGDVKESSPKNGVTIMKMDLHLESGRNSGNAEEVLFIIVKATKAKSSMTELELLSFERMTSYSQFEKCKDRAVPTKLCVCDLPS